MSDYKLPGVELLGDTAASVSLKSILESDAWKSSDARIPVILGMDESAHVVIADLADVPHMLISGVSGSGKSACVNSILMSLLFRFSSSEVKLILIQPGASEFSVYGPLQHLLTPVVYDKRKAAVALHWCMNEMGRRQDFFTRTGSTNIYGFNIRNKGMSEAVDKNRDPIPDRLPSIVIVIEELANIFTEETKDYLEDKIAKITAEGANVGLHLLITTQNPLGQVLSSAIQRNIPVRIVFRLAIDNDSQESCAEILNAPGDMFYLETGHPESMPSFVIHKNKSWHIFENIAQGSQFKQIHGAFVSPKDIGKVVSFIREHQDIDFDNVSGLR